MNIQGWWSEQSSAQRSESQNGVPGDPKSPYWVGGSEHGCTPH